ncbi:gem-associated protein 6 [Gadus macrocephalus]|uniref:gem-associated protein 6 n=1 Tax=Gadus macrocephalus TaxID=80720 RepID=UPI0028CB89BC|nr:gem-associated protein 6 [Gadus macrocephalus]
MSTTSAWRQQTPRDWEHYVNKQVTVTAHGQQQHRGWLHTVDPVTASVVLVQLGGAAGGCSVSVVMGHAVEQVEVVGEADEETAMRLSSLFRSEAPELRGSVEDVKRRREELRGWLQQNRVPVEEVGEDLLVAGVLTVRPPYAEQDCFSSNQMVLARIQGLLARMPTPAGQPFDQPAADGQQSCDQPAADGQQSCDQPSAGF